MLDQKPMWTRCLGGFSVMWVTKLLISPLKNRIFAQKQPNLARNWHFCPLLAHLVPCWWVGWWLWHGLYLARHLFTLYIQHHHPHSRDHDHHWQWWAPAESLLGDLYQGYRWSGRRRATPIWHEACFKTMQVARFPHTNQWGVRYGNKSHWYCAGIGTECTLLADVKT